MKNLSINKKLIVGFGLILLLLLLTIAASVFSIGKIVDQIALYGDHTVPNISTTWKIRRDLVSVERYILQAMNAKGDAAISDALSGATADATTLGDSLGIYIEGQDDPALEALLNEAQAQLEETSAIQQEIIDLISANSSQSKSQAYDLFINEYAPRYDKLAELVVSLNDAELLVAENQKLAAGEAQQTAWTLLAGAGALAVVATVLIVFAIRRSILKPVKEIVGVYGQIAEGNMKTQITYQSRDEMGTMAKLIQKTNQLQNDILADVMEKLTRISQGDVNIRLDKDYPGDYGVLRRTIEETVYALNRTLSIIEEAADQVRGGSSQVAAGAQDLAAGASAQASTVEQLSTAAEMVAAQAAENVNNVKTAAHYVKAAGTGVLLGNEHMQQLSDTMTSISASSNQISSITKVIEDIAFQTNILALNASVEAARAGAAGKGFAVVADEVRNLAGKSAAAAKQTAELIEASVQTVGKGSKITAKTAEILRDVAEKTHLVNDSILKIDKASQEQAGAIEQIRQGIAQVSAVVQTTAATAQENSATSEEMSAQASALREEVGKFQLDADFAQVRFTGEEYLQLPEAAAVLDDDDNDAIDINN